MTLEEIFIKFSYKYDRTGVQRAQRDMNELNEDVQDVSTSVEGLQKALNVLSGVAVAGATAGTYAYQRWSRSMVELSGKAGLTLKQFKELTRTSGQISRRSGLGEDYVREMQQRAFSLGADRRTSARLAYMGSVLHATRQAIGTDAVEAAMALQGSGLGRAIQNLQSVHAASQVGGGNVPDYFAAATTLAASAGPAGVNIEDLLAMLTIGSRGGSLSGAAAGIDQFLLALKREPQKKPGDLYRRNTGQDWTNMDRILQEEGMVSLIRHINEAFKPEEIFQLFGEKEAIKTVALLAGAVEDLAKNREAIASAVERDTIGAFDSDTYREFSRKFDRFTTTMGRFLEAYGEPFAKLLGHLLDALTFMVNAILELNTAMGGMLSWLGVALTGGILAAKGGLSYALFKAFRKGAPAAHTFFGGATPIFGKAGREYQGSVWEKMDEAEGKYRKRNQAFNTEEMVDDVNEKSKQSKPFVRSGNRLSDFASGAATGGFFGWISQGLARLFSGFPSYLSDKLDILKKVRENKPLPVKISDFKDKGLANFAKWVAKVLLFVFASLFSKWIGLAILGLAGLGMLSSDLTPDKPKASQRDYFESQGLPGGEPAPGVADIAAANRALAEAERGMMWDKFTKTVSENLPSNIRYLFDGLIELIDFIGNLFVSLGDVIRNLIADPRATIGMLWDTAWGKSAELDSWLLEKLLVAMGENAPAESKALGRIVDQSTGTQLAQPTIQMPMWMAEELGITGGDFSGHLQAPNVTNIQLPTPPSIGSPSAVGRGSSRFDDADIPYPPINITVGDINIEGAHPDDRFDTAKRVQDAVRIELRNSADYIIQEMGSLASP